MSKTMHRAPTGLVLLSLALTFGCAPAAPSSRAVRPVATSTLSAPVPVPSAAPRRAPLTLEVTVGGRRIRTPLLAVRLGDRDGWVVLDTGAGASVIDKTAADAAGLDTTDMEGLNVKDGTGSARKGARIVRQPPLHAKGLGDMPVPMAIVLPLPPMFAKAGIVGIINPQQLAGPGEATVLDFDAGEVSILGIDAATDRLRSPRLDDDSVRACHEEDGGIASFVYTMNVDVGDAPVRFELDTGAHETAFVAPHKIATRLAAAGGETIESRGAIGTTEATVVQGVKLRAGSVTRTLPRMRISARREADAHDPCTFYGIIGMDALMGCVLVLRRDGFQASCPTG